MGLEIYAILCIYLGTLLSEHRSSKGFILQAYDLKRIYSKCIHEIFLILPQVFAEEGECSEYGRNI